MHVAALIVLVTSAVNAADGAAPGTADATGPLFVWADLAKGETREFILVNGRKIVGPTKLITNVSYHLSSRHSV